MTRITISAAIMMMVLGTITQAASLCEKDLKVSTQSDLDSIKSCKLYTGTITIDSSSAGELALAGVEEINGGLLLSGNLDLRTFQAPDLAKVKGELRVVNHTVLGKLQLPKLVETNTLMLSVLPALEEIDFPAGLTKVDDAHIEDTHAPAVSGFKPEQIRSFTLISNNYLRQFDFSSVKDVLGSLHVASNGNGLDFQANQLMSMQTGDFRHVAQLNLPMLNRVTGDIMFHENGFSQLQVDQLESVKGSLTIANNNQLTMTSFQHLGKVGGAFSIGNNTQLAAIDGFPALTEVDGTVDIAGNVEKYALPVLEDVRGGMRLQTTSSKILCSDLEKKMKTENVVKGTTWSCDASLAESQLQPTLGQDSPAPANIDMMGGGSPSSSSPIGFSGTKGLANDKGKQKAVDGETNNALGLNPAMGWALLATGCAAMFGL
ncbi:hypothetical protein BC941DRAFT_465379 [Chlamydoabsidia padenii]|nr:hypothetical protein BC941DRAFT_465379 [Chlamydoabsidia padenii]